MPPPVAVGVGVGGDRISCGSPTACLAVGESPNANGFGSSTVALEGTKWKTISLPVPKQAQDYTILNGVSCKTATYCLVVGAYQGPLGDKPYILTWNGSSLRAAPAPPLPHGDSFDSLSAVSCVAVKSCVLFGTAYDTNENIVNVIWTWNGSKWATKVAALPGGAQDTQVTAARCFSLTSCEVSGSYDTYTINGTSTTETFYLLFATWNGKTFALQQAAIPAGLNLGTISDISCGSPNSCAATGTGLTITGGGRNSNIAGIWSFVEAWNGQTWTATKWTGPKGSDLSLLGGVSCAAATSCMVVGAAINSTAETGSAVSLVWNGTTWLTAGVPSAGQGLISGFTDVSCPKAGDCVAIGEYGKATAQTFSTLAGYWNGRGWKLTGA
jgi:hypothetical protein